MNDFSQLQPSDESQIDWVNLANVARVHAEAVAADNWVVKVLLTTGTEIVDSRHADKAGAQDRVIAILPGED